MQPIEFTIAKLSGQTVHSTKRVTVITQKAPSNNLGASSFNVEITNSGTESGTNQVNSVSSS